MAATCCVRMMVERALYRYLHDVKKQKKLPSGVGRLAERLKNQNMEDNDCRNALKVLLDNDSLLNRLNLGAHASFRPDPEVILDTWEQVRPLVIWCINQVEGMAKR